MKKRARILWICIGMALLLLAAAGAFQYNRISRCFEGVSAEELARAGESPVALKMELVFKDLFLGSFYRDYFNGLELKPDWRIMDFGAGAGSGAYYLAQRLAAGRGAVVCLDISPIWLKIARNRLAGFPGVEYIAGDIRNLGIPLNSFDAVVIHFVVHDIPPETRGAALRAVAGVMKPGARLYVREPVDLGLHGGRHGITRDELRGLMKKAGLVEKDSGTGTLLLVGDYISGVFVKP